MDRRRTVPLKLYFSPTRYSPEKNGERRLPERTASENRHAPLAAPAVVLRRARKEDPRFTVTGDVPNTASDDAATATAAVAKNVGSATVGRFSRKAARDFFGLRRLSR